jgi:hypothetical protein
MEKEIGRTIALIVVALIPPSVGLGSDQFDPLTPRPSGTSHRLNAIVSTTNDFYVAVGAAGTVLTSPNTLDWTCQVSGTTNELKSVAFGQDLFVAVGPDSEGGMSTILTSADAITWTPRASGTGNALRSVAYNPTLGVFVAVGDSTTILSSTNGVDWARRMVPGYTADLTCVAAYAGFTVLSSDHTYLTSPDGKAWTINTWGTFAKLYACGYGVAVGEAGTIVEDGTVRFSGTAEDLLGVAFAPRTYAGPGGALPGRIGVVGRQGLLLTSDDGVVWTQQATEVQSDLRGLTYSNGGFVAVGDDGVILAGFVWVERRPHAGVTNNDPSGVSTNTLSRVVFGNDNFVAVGGSGTLAQGGRGILVTSKDGVEWSKQDLGIKPALTGIAEHSGVFVAVGLEGTILTSTNGVTWSDRSVAATSDFLCVAYGGTAFVAGGRGSNPAPGPNHGPLVARSSDGSEWVVSQSIPAYASDLAFGNGVFVAVGISPNGVGSILSSEDGLAWALQSSPDTRLAAVVFGNGRFVAAGSSQYFVSSDGSNWTASAQVFQNCVGLCSAQHAFVGVRGYVLSAADGPAYLTSSDALEWTSRGASMNLPQEWLPVLDSQFLLRGVAYGRGTFVAVGDGGRICQSAPVPSLLTAGLTADSVQVTLTGSIGRDGQVLASPHLIGSSWETLVSFTNAPFRTNFVDPVPPSSQSRFYKSVSD